MIKRLALITFTGWLAFVFVFLSTAPGGQVMAQDEPTPTGTTPHIWFHEDFSTRADRWRLFSVDGKSSVSYEEPGQPSGLALEAQAANYGFWTLPDSDLRLDHFNISVGLSAVEGGDDARAGVILNYRAESDMLVLAISPKGMVSLGHYYFGLWSDLIPPVQPVIDPSQPIILGATLDTDQNLTILINGQPNGSLQIKDFHPAGFGLFALTGQNGGVKAVFRSLVVSDL